MFNIFSFENHVIYEITWKNIVKPDRPQMTIRRMRIAYWIPKATNTRSEYVIFIAIPQQQWLHERASALPQAAATLEPEPTQHNSLDRLQIRKLDSTVLLFMAADTSKLIRLACCLPTSPDCLAQQSRFVSSRQSDQIPAAVCIGFECSCNGQNVSNRTCQRYAAAVGPKTQKLP